MKLSADQKWDLFAGAVLLGVLLLFFYQPLFLNKVFYIDDIEGWFHPLQNLKLQMAGAREIYLWNPFQFAGTPYLADPQNALFYPPGWIFFLIKTEKAMVFFVVFHFLLAGAGTYLFLRALHLEPLSCLCGAIFYGFSGFALLHLMHIGILGAYALIPLGLYLTNRLLARGDLVSSLCLGLFMAVLTFNGSFQMTLIGNMIFLIYFFCHMDLKGFFHKDQLKLMGFFLLSVIFGLAVSAVQLIPSFEYLRQTFRGAPLSLADTTAGSISFKDLILTIFPDSYGLPLLGTYRASGAFWEICLYVGILPILLSLFSPFSAPASEKRRMGTFAFMALLGLLLAFGRNTPLYGLMHRIPIINSLRIPARFGVIAIVSMSYFIAVTLDQLPGLFNKTETPQKTSLLFATAGAVILLLATGSIVATKGISNSFIYFALTGAGGLLLIVLAMAGPLKGGPLRILTLILLIISAFQMAGLWNPLADRGHYGRRLMPFGPIKGKKPPVRVHYYPPFSMKDTINMATAAEVSNVVGYNPLGISWYMEFLIYSDFEVIPDENIKSSLLKNGHIFGILNLSKPMLKHLSLYGSYVFTPVPGGFAIGFHRITDGLPRAYLAQNHRVIPDKKTILATLREGKTDPLKTVLLMEDPLISETVKTVRDKTVSGPAAEITGFSPNRIRISINPEQDCWLVLNEIYYPGWTARVDGVERKVYRANYISRGIFVKKGEREAVFTFMPPSVKAGSLISCISLILAAGIFIFSGIRQSGMRRL